MLVETKPWRLYFDGEVRKKGAGVGIVFVTPSGGIISYSFSLLETCPNNVAEYETIIIGLELAIKMHIEQLQVFGDSQLIIRQINGQYEVRNAKLLPLHQRTKNLIAQFLKIEVNHVPRSENDKADALAKLAASLTLPDEREIQITAGKRHLLTSALDRFDGMREENVVSVFEAEEETD